MPGTSSVPPLCFFFRSFDSFFRVVVPCVLACGCSGYHIQHRRCCMVVVVVVVVIVVSTLTRMIKSVVTGQAPVTLELRNIPGKNTHNPRWYTHISQLTQFMPPPETYKSEIGSQSTMCQVHAGAYVSLFTPGETNYSDCHPRKTTT